MSNNKTSKTEKKKQLAEAAYQAAGKAVVSREFGLEVVGATIKPSKANYGKRATKNAYMVDVDRSDEKDINVKRDLTIIFSGSIANQRLNPGWEGCTSCAHTFVDARTERLYRKTEDLVMRPSISCRIHAVAKSLLVHGTLTGRQIDAVSKRAQAKLKRKILGANQKVVTRPRR